MRFGPTSKARSVRTEQIILFRAGAQVFAISSASVQEVRSVDNLASAAADVNEPAVSKVRHAIRRGNRYMYVVNAAVHFSLRPTPAALIFMLRNSRVALLIDGIEKMTTMTHLQALPGSFCHEERTWYRGLTVLDQNVIPVVNPAGFLTGEEISRLDVATSSRTMPEIVSAGGPELSI